MWNLTLPQNVSVTKTVSREMIHRCGESLIYFRYVLFRAQETGSVLAFTFGVGLHRVYVYVSHSTFKDKNDFGLCIKTQMYRTVNRHRLSYKNQPVNAV